MSSLVRLERSLVRLRWACDILDGNDRTDQDREKQVQREETTVNSTPLAGS